MNDIKQLEERIAQLTELVKTGKEIYKLRNRLYKLSNDKWDKWESFERSGCDNKYLLGKARAYTIVVDMIDDLLEDNLGDD